MANTNTTVTNTAATNTGTSSASNPTSISGVTMTIHTAPAPARSDAAATRTSPAADQRRPYAVHGTVLTVGALMWAATIAVFGNEPTSSLGLACQGIGAGAFQVGLLFLLRVLWRSDALGTGKLARTFLRAEAAAVGLAMCSTLADALALSDLSQPGWLALDLFWPLSMMGMFGLAIRIAIAGRWHGVARFWPLVAESWAVVVIPTMNIFGDGPAQVVAAVHLVVGYAVLGQVVARKDPQS